MTREDIVTGTLWVELGLLLYSLISFNWSFALQYFTIFAITACWLYFEDKVLAPYQAPKTKS